MAPYYPARDGHPSLFELKDDRKTEDRSPHAAERAGSLRRARAWLVPCKRPVRHPFAAAPASISA